jgi:Solitary outer membrane autotransporter beta-barrel domain
VKSTIPVRWALIFSFVGGAVRAQIPPLPPGALQQLDSAIGQRVEATAVLGTQSITSRAGLGWKLNDADGTIYKIPWDAELGDPTELGIGDWKWSPELLGGGGYGRFINHFNNNALAGNKSSFRTLALALGGGPRIHFGDSGFSVLPAFSLLYAYTENDFDANNAVGRAIVANGQYVNWNTHTISIVPAFELRYKKTFGRWTPKVTSDFAYYNTQPISRSTDALNFESQSMVWANKFDLDYLTAWKLFHCPVHFGGDVGRIDFYQGLQGALGTDHFYQTDGRITFDVLNRLPKFSSVGFSGGYFWCQAFTGYSIGLEASMTF